LGSKHHVICCGNGIPLALTVTAANRNDITQLLELVDRIAPVGPHGKFRPKVLLADRAYDSRRHRAQLRARGIAPKIAKRNIRGGRRQIVVGCYAVPATVVRQPIARWSIMRARSNVPSRSKSPVAFVENTNAAMLPRRQM
jgi:hypothetical protein